MVEQQVNVLLVDDRPDKLMVLEYILASPDLKLVIAYLGKDALRLVLVYEFAVILVNVSMLIMDSFETASLIRQRKSSEHTPIIFIAAYSDTEMPTACVYSLGAVDYFFAPVAPDILRAKVSLYRSLQKIREFQRQTKLLRKQEERRASSLKICLDDLLNRLNVRVSSAIREGVLLSAGPELTWLFGINPAIDPETFNLVRL